MGSLHPLFGGNFRWELFGKCRMYDEARMSHPCNPRFLCDRAVLLVARSRSDEAGTGSPGFAKTCAVPGNSRSELRTAGNFVWRILIVRHQLPIQP